MSDTWIKAGTELEQISYVIRGNASQFHTSNNIPINITQCTQKTVKCCMAGHLKQCKSTGPARGQQSLRIHSWKLKAALVESVVKGG